MKTIFPILLMMMFAACSGQNSNENFETEFTQEYPETRKGDVTDNYFGTDVADPYRWLEDDLSDETAQWVEAQNEVTFNYLNKIPFRDEIKDRLTEQWNYERLSAPSKNGDYYYYSKNDGLQNHAVIYRKPSLDTDDGEEVFLDPNEFSEDGSTSLAGLSFTKDGSLAAYSISEGGSDWRKVIVINTDDMEQVGDTLTNIKFSGISWKGNDGFYYSSYEMPDGSQLSAMTDQHKLYYHEIGTPQSSDVLVFGGEETPRRYISGSVTDDERFLIISASVSTTGNELYMKSLESEGSDIVPVISDFDNTHSVLDTDGDDLLIYTNLDAENYRLVRAPVSNPSPENWTDVIPETDNVLNVSTAGGYLFANYMVDVQTEVKQYSYSGEFVRDVELPAIGTAGGFSAEKEDDVLYYTFTSFTYPSSIYEYAIETGESQPYWNPEIDFNPDDYVTEQIFYESKDGTEVPMFITYKKGVEKNGENPTYLYAYGGFNVSLRPSFSIARLIWLENGGIYAQPNIRGGGEYGREWHLAGTKLNKQNVFDDFISRR